MDTKKIALVVPTYNAGHLWKKWIDSISVAGITPDQVYIIDSSSTDDTAGLASRAGFNVDVIEKEVFNHGATRQLMVERLQERDLIVFMTQDALCVDESSIENLCNEFFDERVAVVYGRQLPHANATPVAAHARLFNYPDAGRVVTRADIQRLGIKATFCSNSFACYRRKALMEVGGFPAVTTNEDAIVAGLLLLKDWKIVYSERAKVYHSHNQSFIDEYKRYRLIGNFHKSNPWMRETFGSAEREGLRFIKSEINYLLKYSPLSIPSAIFRTFLKYVGFKYGMYL